jgi:hypothetical protein
MGKRSRELDRSRLSWDRDNLNILTGYINRREVSLGAVAAGLEMGIGRLRRTLKEADVQIDVSTGRPPTLGMEAISQRITKFQQRGIL